MFRFWPYFAHSPSFSDGLVHVRFSGFSWILSFARFGPFSLNHRHFHQLHVNVKNMEIGKKPLIWKFNVWGNRHFFGHFTAFYYCGPCSDSGHFPHIFWWAGTCHFSRFFLNSVICTIWSIYKAIPYITAIFWARWSFLHCPIFGCPFWPFIRQIP